MSLHASLNLVHQLHCPCGFQGRWPRGLRARIRFLIALWRCPKCRCITSWRCPRCGRLSHFGPQEQMILV